MSFFPRKTTGVGRGKNMVELQRQLNGGNNDSSDTTLSSSSASENTSLLTDERDCDDESMSGSEIEESTCDDDQFTTEGSITLDEDTDSTSILSREASGDYSRNVSLTNWTGRCSISYSEPLLVNPVSSTTNNLPSFELITNKFRPVVPHQQAVKSPNLLFCSPLKRELTKESKMVTSTPVNTPKRICLDADQVNHESAFSPVRNFEPISSTTKSGYDTQLIPKTVAALKAYPRIAPKSQSPSLSSSTTPKIISTTMQPSQVAKVVGNQGVVGNAQKLNQSSPFVPAFQNDDVIVLPVANELQKNPITQAATLSLLPKTTEILTPQILTKIFGMCSLEDRKNIRLICKDWFDGCSAFEADEKLCVPRYYNDNLTEVMLTIYRSRRRYLNFEFHGLDFGKKPRILFWKICGPKVLSMKLLDCTISSLAFANILKWCYNLQSLEFDFYRLRDMRTGIRLNSPMNVLTAETTNLSLRTLKIRSDVTSLDDFASCWVHWICQFFCLFPNISTFSLCQSRLDERNTTESTSSIDLSNILVNHYFVRTRLESLALNIFYHPGLNWKNLSSVQKLTRITEMAVDFDQNIDLRSFSDFLLHQSNLRGVTLYSSESKIPKEKLDCLATLIMKKRSLREFSLSMSHTVIQWCFTWSLLLNSSNIEVLRINCHEIDFSPVLPAGYFLPVNSKLVTLAIGVENPYNSNIVALLNSFHKLESVHLSYMGDEIMNSLCNREHEIKSLTVNRTLSNEDVMCRLRNLVKLEAPETLKLEGHLFNLKHLRVLRPAVLESEDKDFLPNNYLGFGNLQSYRSFCPSLEVLWIDCFVCRLFCGSIPQLFDIIDGILSCMKELKFLYFAHTFSLNFAYQPRLTEEEAALIFKKYDSLRVFMYGDVFVKDIVDKRIRKLYRNHGSKDEILKKYTKDCGEWDYQYNDDFSYINPQNASV